MNDSKTKGTDKESSSSQTTVTAAAKEMQDHFYHTGLYRSEDVRHVLGNPGDGVKVQAIESYSLSLRKSR